MTVFSDRSSLILGVLGAFALLYALAPKGESEIKFEELALGTANTVAIGVVADSQVHCHDFDDLDKCLASYHDNGRNTPVALWLGNSQVHAINQYQPGQETAAPELHRLTEAQHRYFLTISQPNASLLEHYLLFSYLLGKLPIDTLVLPVVFDDMREDGIRTSLADALKNADTIGILERTAVGRSLVINNGDQDAAGNDTAALADTPQERYERFLNRELARLWPLWAERPALRGELMLSLYLFRNWVLGIDPSSTRKVIPGRYARNREALAATLHLARARGIKVLVYVVPLRSDVKVPYDPAEYAAFKEEVGALATTTGARFANLEKLVPADLWGAKASTTLGVSEELDFMHFQAPGHRLLAAALHRELQSLWGTEASR